MKLVPNPARDFTKVNFEMEEQFTASNKSIPLYSTQVILLKSYSLKDIIGTIDIGLESLPSVSYLVILTVNGMNLSRELLIKK